MKLPMTAIALGLAAMGMTAPAYAVTATVMQDEKAPNLSKKGQKALTDLQTAIGEERWGDVPALIQAARSVAETDDDKKYSELLTLDAALKQGNYEDAIAPVDALAAMGAMEDNYIQIYLEVGKQRLFDGNIDGAATLLDKALQHDPGNSDALIALAEARIEQGRVDDSIRLLSEAIKAAEAAGTADENWYKRAVKMAYDNESPAVFGITRDWVKAYPSATNWRDTLPRAGDLLHRNT